MKKDRLIAIAMAFALAVLQMPCMALAAGEDAQSSEAMTIMSALGFMRSIPADDENAAVTKGMFAATVVDLIGAKVGTAEFESPFADVNDSTNYKNEICLAAQYGIVHGGENAKFEPDAVISYSEAVVMLVNALGYYDYAIAQGGYPNGFMNIASNVGITKGVSAGEKTRLTAGMCAKLLLNAGNSKIATVIPGVSEIKIEKGEKLFWEKHKIETDTGILEANAYTSITDANGVGKNKIKIGGNVASVYYSNENMDYLGYNVEYYYRDNDGDLTVLYMTPKKMDVTVINADDIEGYDDGVLSYTENDCSKKLNIYKSVSVIYNGVYTNSYYLLNGKSIFTPDNGEVKAIDNNNDGKTEIISILDYQNLVVSAVNTSDNVVYDKYSAGLSLDFTDKNFENDAMWVLTDESGNVKTYDEVKEKDIISVALSADKRVMRGVISSKTAKGRLSQLGKKDGEIVATVDGVEYELANDNISGFPSVGENVTLSLDFCGKVADIVSEAASESRYAFIMKKYLDETDDRYYLKLLLPDGSKKDFIIAEKVTIDGTKYVKDDELRNEIQANLSDYQVALIKRNSKDEITLIDTMKNVMGGNNDVLRAFQDAPTAISFFSSIGSFNGQMLTNGKTVVFRTPSEASKTDYDLYSVGSLPEGTNVKLTVRGFSSDPRSFTADCIQYVSDEAAGFGANSPYMVISDITDTINEDDESVKEISGYDQKGEVKLTIAIDYSEGKYGVAIDTLKVGDVIKYSKNERGELVCASPVHRINTNLPGKFVEDFYQEIYWSSRTAAFGRSDFFSYAGYLLAKEDRTIALVENTTDLTVTNLKPEIAFKLVDNTKAYYVSKGKKTVVEPVSNKNLGYLSDYKNTRCEQQVVVITSNGEPKLVVAYE